MSAEIIQFRPKPKQSTDLTDLIELGHHLILTAMWDADATWAGTQTGPTYRADNYVAPPDDCA